MTTLSPSTEECGGDITTTSKYGKVTIDLNTNLNVKKVTAKAQAKKPPMTPYEILFEKRKLNKP
jgi:hypothetical protein